jgi:hypothetical protein
MTLQPRITTEGEILTAALALDSRPVLQLQKNGASARLY